ncbi:MAG: L-seryl-tRNA(Sec) selenium transferase [Planctomycetes bacterium]|nr:L-seryl-tRNA(Sec) selenium transferase [Planctomycetota bacterium]
MPSRAAPTNAPDKAPPRSPRDLLRRLPQVDKLLQLPEAEALLGRHPRPEVVRSLRQALDGLRAHIQSLYHSPAPAADGRELEALGGQLEPPAVFQAAAEILADRNRPHYQRVVNGTGIILHTGLGRAVLPARAVEALSEALRGYTLVEVDRGTGERNRREDRLAQILCELTGAEAATAVNNNAAATLIILAALARGREVIISRGQLIEIGGAFRIPQVMEESGARLVEVGTTNRTYIEDYRSAVTAETALLLQVHTSNYEIAGFANHTPLEEIVALGREKGIPVASDLGSGCFVDLSPYGFRREPLVAEVVRRGPDLVCFSGDKLLGGPQAGIILGKKELLERIRRHPIFRAVRIDKMALVALEATLRLYRDPAGLFSSLPPLLMITRPEKEVRRRAERFRRSLLRRAKGGGLAVELVKESSQAGSGSLPAQNLPTWAAALEVEGLASEELAARLRAFTPPIFTRIQDGRVLVDFRTLLPGEEKFLAGALLGLKNSRSSPAASGAKKPKS